MTPAQKHGLERMLATALDVSELEIRSSRSCSGGCIHHAHLVELNDGQRYFVKSSAKAAAMFEQEAAGLEALSRAAALRVPAVVTSGQLDEQHDCLVLEALESAAPMADFWERFGRGLASLHHTATATHYGWSNDNFLGSNLQRNAQADNWIEFFAERRLGYQLRLARQQGLGSRELFKLTERLITRLANWLDAPQDPPSLLHGDLWSGNYLADERGAPAVFDPAVYYGRREAELAMPLLFGGFPPTFFSAYDEAWPLEAGWRERVEIYKLYHLLNHLNLFGSGYLDSCLEIARRFAG